MVVGHDFTFSAAFTLGYFVLRLCGRCCSRERRHGLDVDNTDMVRDCNCYWLLIMIVIRTNLQAV
jgi:hypothetical protein